MPYTHREVGDKECVYKKDAPKGSDPVGCTKGSINKYLGALHANVKTENVEEELQENLLKLSREKIVSAANQVISSIQTNAVNTSDMFTTIWNSVKEGEKLTKEEKNKIGTDLRGLLESLGYGAVFMLPGGTVFLIVYKFLKKHMENKKEEQRKARLNESNKLKGGKADKLSIKDIADKFNTTTDKIRTQLTKGVKVEMEHTKNKAQATEIATDHISEFRDYYDRLEKMEKEAKKYWASKIKKETMNEGKSLIKRLVRENIQNSSIKQELEAELKRLGVSRNDAYIIFDNNIQTEGLDENVKKTLQKFKTELEATSKYLVICGALLTGAVACKKQDGYVYKFSYHVDKLVTYTLIQDAELDNNLHLDAGQQFGIMDGAVYNPNNNLKISEDAQKTIFNFIKNNPDLFTNNSAQQYNPQEQVGSWYFLEEDILPDAEREAKEDELAAQEEVSLTGKDYTITDEYTLDYIGPSKHGDIETTNGN